MRETANYGLVKGLRRFKRYSTYKDSGVEWLGPIPILWHMRKLKYVSVLIMGQSPPSERYNTVGNGPPFLQGNADFGADHPEPRVFCPGAPKTVCRGDHLISVRAPVGAINTADQQYGIGRGLCGVRVHPSFLDNRFARWMLMVSASGLATEAVGSTYEAVSAEDVARLAVPIPTVLEQCRIAEFIDRETKRIDSLIARKRRLIELLEEERTAVVATTVAKGLNPNVSMRDSAISWLGRMPTHWQLVPIKSVVSKADYGISESLSGAGEIPVLTMAHVQNGEVHVPESGDIDIVDEALLLDNNDLLFNRTNSRDLVAKVGIFRGSRQDRVTFASYLVRLRARLGIVPEWLNFVLNSTGVLGVARSMALLSVNQANLNPNRYGQVLIPLPPVGEQIEIATLLQREVSRLDALIGRIGAAVDMLEEFRVAVISSAVTGQIDVREETL